MTEMHKPDMDTSLDDLSIAHDLAAEAGDDTIRSILGQARTAWFSTAETQPTDELRAFISGATRSAPDGSPRAWTRWSTPVIDTLSNLWPRSGRAAFGASLAALTGIVIVASFALAAPNPEQIGAASSESSSTSVTVMTTPTTSPTSTSSTISSTTVADQPPTRITVADAGTADIAVSNGAPVLVSTDPAPGWRVVEEVPDEPNEIDLSYRRGDDRVDLDVEIEDGQIRVRVRDRRTDTRTESYLGSTTITTDRGSDDDGDMSSSDDDRDHRDNSGSGSDDDNYGEDNSGPGNAEDRSDSSGSGSSSDDDDDGEDKSGSSSESGQ